MNDDCYRRDSCRLCDSQDLTQVLSLAPTPPANAFVASFMGSPPMNLLQSDEVQIGFRPHDCAVSENGALHVQVELVEALGHESLLHAKVIDGILNGAIVRPAQTLVASLPCEIALTIGQQIRLQIKTSALHKFHAESGARLE